MYFSEKQRSEHKFCFVENRVFPFSEKQLNISSHMLEHSRKSMDLCLFLQCVAERNILLVTVANQSS